MNKLLMFLFCGLVCVASCSRIIEPDETIEPDDDCYCLTEEANGWKNFANIQAIQ